MKNLLTMLFFLIVFSYTVTSQVVSKEELYDLLNSQEIQIDNPIISNFLMIRQISEDNSAVSVQNNPGNVRNNVLINQNGTGNAGFVEQAGSGLETRLWQYNANNEANLLSEGNNILTSAKQEGDGNSIYSYIKNYDLESRTAMLLQKGNNNRIELAMYGDDAPPFDVNSQEMKITQRGNNHVVEAFMENDFRSMEIEQTSGADGSGMQIEVTQSFFSFPMK